MYNKYNQAKIQNHIQSNLPMDEFVKWNFAKAGEIIDQYQEFLAICLDKANNKFLEWKSMTEYLKTQLENLGIEKDKLESELKDILDKMNERKKLTEELKKHKKLNKKWEAIWKKFKELKFDVNEFEDFLDDVKRNNPDNYKQGEEEINEFLDSESYKKIKEWNGQNSLWLLERERNNITRKLSHKSNTMNVKTLIEEIKTWKTKNMLENYISDDVKQIFWKKKDFYGREDPRSLKEIYMQTLSSMIILNKDADNKIRKELIKKYNDKIWLWKYVWDIYQDLKMNEFRIRENLWTQNNIEINLQEEIKKSIIEEIKYRIDFCKVQYPMWRNAIDDSDIDYLKHILNWEKSHAWNIEIDQNRRVREIFYTLRDYLEDIELENKFEMIWNYMYQWIGIDTAYIQNILIELFKYMDQEDRKEIEDRFGNYNLFKKIEEENKIENRQLELFN